MNKEDLMATLSTIEKKTFKETLNIKNLHLKEQIDTSTCPGLLMVKSGNLRVFLITENGREITLFSLIKDDICILSSPCILGDFPFNIFIEARDTSIIEIIPRSTVENTKANNPEFSNLLLTLVGEKMGITLSLIDEILVKRIDSRIAKFLVQSGNITDMTHEDIANHIGSSREVVSRVLKHMQRDEIIDIKRKTIIIKDLDQLKSLTFSD